MIRDPKIAQQISNLMLEFQSRLDNSIAMVRANCSPEEFANYRRAVGRVMGEMLLAVLNPLYKEHPSLKPPELESARWRARSQLRLELAQSKISRDQPSAGKTPSESGVRLRLIPQK